VIVDVGEETGVSVGNGVFVSTSGVSEGTISVGVWLGKSNVGVSLGGTADGV
jgi:hypothetical protein